MAGITTSTTQFARWGVMWVYKGQVYEKRTGPDLCEALKVYERIKAKPKRQLVTLRCLNAGFPPPEHILHHEYFVIEQRFVKGRKRKVKIKKTRNLMDEYNRKGVWWCCYCMKLRRFVPCDLEGDNIHLECPLCEITTRDGLIRRANPMALNLEFRKKISEKKGSERGRSTHSTKRKRSKRRSR